MDDTEIEVFSMDMRLMWAFVVIFGGMGFFVLATPFMAAEAPTSDDWTGVVIVGLVAFAAAAVFFYIMRTHHGRVVAIGPNGVFDRRIMKRPVDWDEVRSVSVFDTYVNAAQITMIALEIDDVAGVNRRPLGAVGEAMKGAVGMPAIAVQLTGLKPSKAAALEAFLRHLPGRLQGDHLPRADAD